MKFFIRILWFFVTMLIYKPIMDALHGANASTVFIVLIAFILFLFVYYIPSNAFVSMWKKYADEKKSKASTKESIQAAPKPSESTSKVCFISNPRFRPPYDALVSYSTSEGESLRLPAIKIDRIRAASSMGCTICDPHWTTEYTKLARQVAGYLLHISTQYINNTSSPQNLIYITVIWSTLFYATLDILIANHISYEVESQFRICNQETLSKIKGNSNFVDSMVKCHANTIGILERSSIDPSTKEGIEDLLKYALKYKFLDDECSEQNTQTPDAIEMFEYSLAVSNAVEYTANLFSKQ